MATKLTLVAQGSFKSHLTKHFEYPEEWYAEFEDGESLITTLNICSTANLAEKLCDALNIQLRNLRTHANIDVSGVTKKDLLKADFDDNQIYNFFALRKAQYKFSVLIDC